MQINLNLFIFSLFLSFILSKKREKLKNWKLVKQIKTMKNTENKDSIRAKTKKLKMETDNV